MADEAIGIVADAFRDPSMPKTAERILSQAPRGFALAAVSMGGIVAVEIMKFAPERVTRLALVDANDRPDTLAQKAYLRATNLAAGALSDAGCWPRAACPH